MSERSSDVAIVGMACILPGAEDLGAYWQNLRAGVDAITALPDGRWEPEFYDPDSDAVDRIYCDRGGFIDAFARVDPLRWGLMPKAVEGAEPDQLLVLETAARALADAGYGDRGLPTTRTGVALGRGAYMTAGVRRYSQASTHLQEFTSCIRALVPDIAPDRLETLRQQYLQHLPDMSGSNVIGLVPNLAASRIANRLDLQGPAYTVDAACASSLLALDQACSELVRGRSDVMLAGGVHVGMGPAFWSVFCQLGALSRSGRCRPFHREADGLLIGEGVGMVVLKRLSDADRDGDRIYAVVRGSGASSDGREASLMNPRTAGQRLAIDRAWESAGLDPEEPGAIGFLEAHGTATAAGDAAELRTILDVFGPRRDGSAEAVFGSVKSMIGHAMPAAGIAGLIKTALALHHRTVLPTLHCDAPHEGVEKTRFRLATRAEPWDEPGQGRRRAGVNAFGFGGINAHVVLEEAPGRDGSARGPGPAADAAAFGSRKPPVLLVSGESAEELLAGLDGGRSVFGAGPCRVAVLDPNPERIARARRVVELGRPFRDRKGHVWFAPEGELARGGKIAFLYPGLDSGSPRGIADVALEFGGAGLGEHDPDDLEEVGAAIVLSGTILTEVLGQLGVEPDFVCGHSIGEWSAMIAAGSIPREAVEDVLRTVAPGEIQFPDVSFAGVGAGMDRLEPLLGADLTVALDNCPHQTVICGPAEAIQEAMARLRSEGVLCQELSFRSGFHSPFFEPYLGPVESQVERIPFAAPERPLWSATTCRPFPRDPEEIRRLFLEHLVQPVRFRELVEALHGAGARVFVQVGPGSLVGFVDDTLKGRSHAALPALDARTEPLEQLRRLVTALWVEGLEPDMRRLMAPIGEDRAAGKGVTLDLTTAIARVQGPLPRGNGTSPDLAEAAGDPVVAEFDAATRALDAARRDILEAWRRRGSAATPPEPRSKKLTRTISLESHPELVDHSLFPLPEGWERLEDGFPVVPMTMSLSLMMEAARALVPERTVVGIADVRAFRWMPAGDPLELEIEASYDGADTVEVALGPYLQGRVRLADGYETPPAPEGPLEKARPIQQTAREMYDSRLMFHGPAYQAVHELVAIQEDGIHGRVQALPARGSLLDGCGQVLGYWIRQHTNRDRLAFPVMIDSLTFYGPEPEPGTILDCVVRLRHFGRSQVRCDFEVTSSDGRVWVRCEGWQDRRIPNEPWMWAVIHRPEDNTLAEPVPEIPGACWLDRPVEPRTTRDSFARRYLGQAGFAEWDELPDGRRREDWLAGRIAAKDAARHWLWQRGRGSIFPVEVDILSDPRGAPRVVSPHTDSELFLSIAHRDGTAVAMVADHGPPGIDLERIEERGEGFDQVAFTAEERRLLPADGRDEWRTRFWAAKEAVAKCLGTGLEGAPKAFEIERMEGESVVCRGMRVGTLRRGEWVLAWTIGDER